jgi:excisionase family DNA binding protein
MDELLTVAEIAERLKLNQQTIRNWIGAGRLPAVRVGRRVRVRRQDFDALVEHGQTCRKPSRRRASGTARSRRRCCRRKLRPLRLFLVGARSDRLAPAGP